ncbi:hypothetical protein ACOME3_005663 [Neoechinorhynchus agilis]
MHSFTSEPRSFVGQLDNQVESCKQVLKLPPLEDTFHSSIFEDSDYDIKPNRSYSLTNDDEFLRWEKERQFDIAVSQPLFLECKTDCQVESDTYKTDHPTIEQLDELLFAQVDCINKLINGNQTFLGYF